MSEDKQQQTDVFDLSVPVSSGSLALPRIFQASSESLLSEGPSAPLELPPALLDSFRTANEPLDFEHVSETEAEADLGDFEASEDENAPESQDEAGSGNESSFDDEPEEDAQDTVSKPFYQYYLDSVSGSFIQGFEQCEPDYAAGYEYIKNINLYSGSCPIDSLTVSDLFPGICFDSVKWSHDNLCAIATPFQIRIYNMSQTLKEYRQARGPDTIFSTVPNPVIQDEYFKSFATPSKVPRQFLSVCLRAKSAPTWRKVVFSPQGSEIGLPCLLGGIQSDLGLRIFGPTGLDERLHASSCWIELANLTQAICTKSREKNFLSMCSRFTSDLDSYSFKKYFFCLFTTIAFSAPFRNADGLSCFLFLGTKLGCVSVWRLKLPLHSQSGSESNLFAGVFGSVLSEVLAIEISLSNSTSNRICFSVSYANGYFAIVEMRISEETIAFQELHKDKFPDSSSCCYISAIPKSNGWILKYFGRCQALEYFLTLDPFQLDLVAHDKFHSVDSRALWNDVILERDSIVEKQHELETWISYQFKQCDISKLFVLGMARSPDNLLVSISVALQEDLHRYHVKILSFPLIDDLASALHTWENSYLLTKYSMNVFRSVRTGSRQDVRIVLDKALDLEKNFFSLFSSESCQDCHRLVMATCLYRSLTFDPFLSPQVQQICHAHIRINEDIMFLMHCASLLDYEMLHSSIRDRMLRFWTPSHEMLSRKWIDRSLIQKILGHFDSSDSSGFLEWNSISDTQSMIYSQGNSIFPHDEDMARLSLTCDSCPICTSSVSLSGFSNNRCVQGHRVRRCGWSLGILPPDGYLKCIQCNNCFINMPAVFSGLCPLCHIPTSHPNLF